MTLILEQKPKLLCCSFCGKTEAEAQAFVRTDRLMHADDNLVPAICDECVSLAKQIMEGKVHFLEVNKLREDKWAGLAANKVLDVRVKELQNMLATSLDMLRWASGAFTVAGYPGMWDRIGAGFVKQLEGMGLNGKGSMSHGVSLGVFSKPILIEEWKTKTVTSYEEVFSRLAEEIEDPEVRSAILSVGAWMRNYHYLTEEDVEKAKAQLMRPEVQEFLHKFGKK